MKLIAALILGLLVATPFAQRLPVEDTGPITEIDKNGVEKKMDFKLPLIGVSDQGLLFSHFSQRPLLIYYFSAKCPHCQKSYPGVQKLSDQYTPKGLTTIAVAVSHNKKSDIRSFISDIGVRVPMLQDKDRKFSDLYGSGSVPLVILVQPDGTFIRYTNVHKDKPFLTKKLEGMFK